VVFLISSSWLVVTERPQNGGGEACCAGMVLSVD